MRARRIELTLERAKELRAALDRAIAAADFEEAEVRGKGAALEPRSGCVMLPLPFSRHGSENSNAAKADTWATPLNKRIHRLPGDSRMHCTPLV